MPLLTDKVVIVTGAGRGLGRAEALELAAQGARLVVNDYGRSLHGDTEASAADQVVAEIKAAGGEAVANYDDVADFEAAKAMVDQAVATFGSLDILVNNAGFLRDKMIFNMEESDWDDVIRVHLKGHFAMSRWASVYFRDKAKATDGPIYGRIINTASEAGLVGPAGQPNYAAAKAGIMQLTLATGAALAKYGVTVNAICPRARTRMTEAMDMFSAKEGEFDTFAPENVAPLVAYLASPAAAAVSGQVFVAWGRMITVMAGPSTERRFDSEATWTPESVADALSEFYAGRKFFAQGFAAHLGG